MASKTRYRNATGGSTLYKSSYAARWTGVILCRIHDDCYLFCLLTDRHGNPMRRRVLRVMHIAWTKEAGTVDLATVNQDWLIVPQVYTDIAARNAGVTF